MDFTSQASVNVLRVIGTAFLALVLTACQGSSGIQPGLVVPGKDTVQLSLQLFEPAGGKFTCLVNAVSDQRIYQLSTRIMFDPQAVRPVEVTRGGLVGEPAVFFSLSNQPGFVPLAFTYHPEDSYIELAGSVALIEFEVLDSSLPANIHFTPDTDYLIARDASGSYLPVQLAVGK